jgi:hypothetical protein
VSNGVEQEAGPPRSGGKLTIGISGETNSYNPSMGQWSAASYAVANAVYDPLAALDPTGNPQPYLAQAITPSSDFTEWTITLRPDIRFHNGQPLDAAAVKNLDGAMSSMGQQASPPVESVSTTGDSIVTVNEPPWSTFAWTLTVQTATWRHPPCSMTRQERRGADRDRSRSRSRPTDRWFRQDDEERGTTGRRIRPVRPPYLDAVEFKVVTDASVSSMHWRPATWGRQIVTRKGWARPLTRQPRRPAGAQQRQPRDRRGRPRVQHRHGPFSDPIAGKPRVRHRWESVAQIAFRASSGAWGMFEAGSPYFISKEQAGYRATTPTARRLVARYEQTHGQPLQFGPGTA